MTYSTRALCRPHPQSCRLIELSAALFPHFKQQETPGGGPGGVKGDKDWEVKDTTNTEATMAYRLFEGKDHASIYQKFRFTPPEELKNTVLQWLDKKVSFLNPGKTHSCCAEVHMIRSNKCCMSVNILRRDSPTCWRWTWGVGRGRILGCSPLTSGKWWALTSASVSWRRPELCRDTPTSHTGGRENDSGHGEMCNM